MELVVPAHEVWLGCNVVPLPDAVKNLGGHGHGAHVPVHAVHLLGGSGLEDLLQQLEELLRCCPLDGPLRGCICWLHGHSVLHAEGLGWRGGYDCLVAVEVWDAILDLLCGLAVWCPLGVQVV